MALKTPGTQITEYQDLMACDKCNGYGTRYGYSETHNDLRYIPCEKCGGSGSKPNPNTTLLEDGLRVELRCGEQWIAVGWMPKGSRGIIKKLPDDPRWQIVFDDKQNKPGYYCAFLSTDGLLPALFSISPRPTLLAYTGQQAIESGKTEAVVTKHFSVVPSVVQPGVEDPPNPAPRAPMQDRPPGYAGSHCPKRVAPRAP